MREIKFRAWDKNGKGFINGFNMLGFSTGQGAPTKFLQRFNSEWKEEDVVIQQYTGLKDKTGKEVYEGDIIVCGHDTGKSYNRYIIEFSDSAHAYLARQVGCTSHIGSGYWGNTMLVIGNIHENPELLEVTR